MQITFLGTSSMVPTRERNQSGIFISSGSEGILIDCGEGVQRQLKISGIKLTKITKILISHWHGDHVLGLPGLIQSLGALDYNKTLKIFGPDGTDFFFKKILGTFIFKKKIDVEITEAKDGRIFENDSLILKAEKLKHNAETLGYSLVEKDKRKINLNFIKKFAIPEGPLLGKLQKGKNIMWRGKKINADDATYAVKGKKVAIINDTLPCKGATLLAKDADLLICEATYTSELEGKALEYKHMTARQAAELAIESNAKKLVLTHFSARYKNTKELEKDARNCFDNVLCAKDFMRIEI